MGYRTDQVVRTALSNAASIAGLLLTTDALITDEEEEKTEGQSHAIITTALLGEHTETAVGLTDRRFSSKHYSLYYF